MVTPLVIVTSVRAVHPANMDRGTIPRLAGIVAVVKAVHPPKQYSAIEFTLLGNTTDVSALQ